MTAIQPGTRRSSGCGGRRHVRTPPRAATRGAPRDKPALLDATTGRALTYRALAHGIERVAAGLKARGFAKGDVLAVYSPNLPDYALAVYGAMAAGGTVTGADPSLTAGELAGQLAAAGRGCSSPRRRCWTWPPRRRGRPAWRRPCSGLRRRLVEHDIRRRWWSPTRTATSPRCRSPAAPPACRRGWS